MMSSPITERNTLPMATVLVPSKRRSNQKSNKKTLPAVSPLAVSSQNEMEPGTVSKGAPQSGSEAVPRIEQQALSILNIAQVEMPPEISQSAPLENLQISLGPVSTENEIEPDMASKEAPESDSELSQLTNDQADASLRSPQKEKFLKKIKNMHQQFALFKTTADDLTQHLSEQEINASPPSELFEKLKKITALADKASVKIAKLAAMNISTLKTTPTEKPEDISSAPLEDQIKEMHINFSQLKTQVDQLIVRLETLETIKVDYTVDYKVKASYPLKDFKADLKELSRLSEEESTKMTQVATKVKEQIAGLNNKLRHRSKEEQTLFNNLVSAWNNISTLADEIRWKRDLLKNSTVLAEARSFSQRVHSSWSEIHQQKTYKSQNQLTKWEKEEVAQEKNIEKFMLEFEYLNKEATRLETEIKKLKKNYAPIKVTSEMLHDYANPEQTGHEQTNKLNLETVAQHINGTANEIHNVQLSRYWKQICEDLKDYAIQLTQYAAKDGVGIKSLFAWGIYSTGILRDGKQVELKVAVAYDENLFKVASPS